MSEKKAPKWIKWIGRQIVAAIVRVADRNDDGKVTAGEVIATIIEIVEPHLHAHPEVDSD